MKNVCQLAARKYRRKKLMIREYLDLPFALLRIWWESPADAAEEVRYINLCCSQQDFSSPRRRIAEALRRRAACQC